MNIIQKVINNFLLNYRFSLQQNSDSVDIETEEDDDDDDDDEEEEVKRERYSFEMHAMDKNDDDLMEYYQHYLLCIDYINSHVVIHELV